MVSLLGTEDRLLKTLEATYPTVEVTARGNQITLTGSAAEVAAAHGFSDVDHTIELFGTCADCRSR